MISYQKFSKNFLGNYRPFKLKRPKNFLKVKCLLEINLASLDTSIEQFILDLDHHKGKGFFINLIKKNNNFLIVAKVGSKNLEHIIDPNNPSLDVEVNLNFQKNIINMKVNNKVYENSFNEEIDLIFNEEINSMIGTWCSALSKGNERKSFQGKIIDTEIFTDEKDLPVFEHNYDKISKIKKINYGKKFNLIFYSKSELITNIFPNKEKIKNFINEFQFLKKRIDKIKSIQDTVEETKLFKNVIKIKHNIFRLNNTNIQNLKNNLETYLNDNYFIQAANELRLVLDSGYALNIENYFDEKTEFTFIKTDDYINRNIQNFDFLSKKIIGSTHKLEINNFITAYLIACIHFINRHKPNDETYKNLVNISNNVNSIGNHILVDMIGALSEIEALTKSNNDQKKIFNFLLHDLVFGGNYHKIYFEFKTCNLPFDGFELSPDERIHGCCPSHLQKPFGYINNIKSIEDIKKLKGFKEIKKSIVNKTYHFCKWTVCPQIRKLSMNFNQNKKPDYNPTDFRLSYDPTCNLWCPSCRSNKITVRGKEKGRIMKLTSESVLPLLKNAKKCMMNGYGDIFASRACREILANVNKIDYPELKFHFITNGVLFTEKFWKTRENLHQMVDSIRVSIDASSKKVYDVVRLGGKWDVLMENLKFISRLRKEKIIKNFSISFVVQYENVSEMNDFVIMGKNLGCDRVIFEKLMDWNSMKRDAFYKNAVHLKESDKHDEFLIQKNMLEKNFSREFVGYNF